jgi:hypothetical protein
MKGRKAEEGECGAEVSLVSQKGIWVLVGAKEYFLAAAEYPWFAKAKVAEVMNVELLGNGHLRWPDLDVDLEVASLEYPEKYPLVYKQGG